MRLIYDGPQPGQVLPRAGITAKRGEPTEVPDDLAPELLDRGDWREPEPEAKDDTDKPAARPRSGSRTTRRKG